MLEESEPVIAVRSSSATDMSSLLEAAHKQMIAAALQEGSHGILVTKHEFGHCTVALSDLVPFGQTLEKWSRRGSPL